MRNLDPLYHHTDDRRVWFTYNGVITQTVKGIWDTYRDKT